jgi:type IX secretion system PorP/SprF family membrane protein
MKNLHHKLLLLPFFALPALLSQAQDAEFTQFFASPVYTNPAFAGSSAGGRITMNFRNQWPSLPGSFVTYSAAYDQHFRGIGGGIGIIATGDKAGPGLLTTNSISGIYAYEIRAGRKKDIVFKASMQASFVHKYIDFSKLTFTDMIEPKSGFKFPTNEPFPASPNKSFANFSTGFLMYTRTFYTGLAVHNLTQPNESFYNNASLASNLPRRYSFHAGMVIPLDNNKNKPLVERNTLSPNILIMKQAAFNQVNMGFYINRGPLVTGLWYRQTSENGDALMLLLGFRQNNFRVAYSYDLTVSDAKPAAPGSHEFSVSVEWKTKNTVRRVKTHICPTF